MELHSNSNRDGRPGREHFGIRHISLDYVPGCPHHQPFERLARVLASESSVLTATGSAALRADAAQSVLCAYLSLIALVGLAINAIWTVKWADPVAALAVLPLIVWEGREAMRGKTCDCC